MGCGGLKGEWALPIDASTDGHLIDRLIHVSLLFVGVLFLVMVAWMLYACVRHGRSHRAEPLAGTSRRGKVLPWAIAAVVLFVVDGNLFFHSTRDMAHVFWNFARAEGHPEAVRIEVNARQWAWDARYPGPDGQFNTRDDVVTTNDIRVPEGAPILVQLAAVDVIHSFYLPHFRVKMDAVPGSIHQLWFQPKTTGTFDIGCAQHCGVNHYKMRGTLIVMPRGEYRSWVAWASEQAVVAHDPTDTEAQWGWSWKQLP
jgi:cytochrome c oxidase subunit 2